MYRSEQNRIAFIAVPRTGSTTVAQILRAHCPDLVQVGPVTAEGHHAVSRDAADYRDVRVVAFHRHPFARLFSDWRRAHARNPGKHATFPGYLRRLQRPVDEARKMRDRQGLMAKRSLGLSCTLWMDVARPAGIISWHPFAKLIETICSWPFVPMHAEIPHLKQSDATLEQMAREFEPEQVRRLAVQLHCEDFDRWGYDRNPTIEPPPQPELHTKTDGGLPIRETVLDDAAADELEQLLDGAPQDGTGNP